MWDDSIWDEDRWEAFLREQDERVERFMRHINRFISQHPPPRNAEEGDLAAWELRLKRYLLGRGWEMEELEIDAFEDEYEDEIGFLFGRRSDANGEPEENLANPVAPRLLSQADALSAVVQGWADALPGDQKDSSLVQFCMHVMQVGVNLAKGHEFGVEIEMLGGNIACAKRALRSSNEALAMLPDLKSKPYMAAEFYRDVYERTYELRNEVGIHVQELRGRFNLGID